MSAAFATVNAMATPPPDTPELELAWFSALCDDDYRWLGVPDPTLRSSFDHCADIVTTAERGGFDNVLLPSGYDLGIDSIAFAGGVATLTDTIKLLVAVRCGELWPPQLARQLATLDQMLGGRLTINIISSDLPGAPVASRTEVRTEPGGHVDPPHAAQRRAARAPRRVLWT